MLKISNVSEFKEYLEQNFFQVRKKAQAVLGAGFHLYAYSYRAVIHEVVDCLKDDSSIEHHQLKVSDFLSSLLEGKKKSFMSYNI